jgi:hypothetical protein
MGEHEPGQSDLEPAHDEGATAFACLHAPREVQTGHAPATEPSGASKSSLVAVIRTCRIRPRLGCP